MACFEGGYKGAGWRVSRGDIRGQDGAAHMTAVMPMHTLLMRGNFPGLRVEAEAAAAC